MRIIKHTYGGVGCFGLPNLKKGGKEAQVLPALEVLEALFKIKSSIQKKMFEHRKIWIIKKNGVNGKQYLTANNF